MRSRGVSTRWRAGSCRRQSRGSRPPCLRTRPHMPLPCRRSKRGPRSAARAAPTLAVYAGAACDCRSGQAAVAAEHTRLREYLDQFLRETARRLLNAKGGWLADQQHRRVNPFTNCQPPCRSRSTSLRIRSPMHYGSTYCRLCCGRLPRTLSRSGRTTSSYSFPLMRQIVMIVVT